MKINGNIKLTLTFFSNYFNQRYFWIFMLLFPSYSALHGQSPNNTVTPTALSVVVSGTNVSYQWYSNTTNSTSNATIINSATSSSYTPPLTSVPMFYFVLVQGDCGSTVTSSVVQVLISDHFVWNGNENTDWNTASNWTPSGVPSATSIVTIPNCTNNPIHSSLSIACGGSVNLASGATLTLSGLIYNEGTFIMGHGATLVQNGNGNNVGLGTYIVKQWITGDGGSTPNGRFWYLGSPMSHSFSQVYHAETETVLKYYNEPTESWVEINDATTPIEIGKGYFVQTGAIDTLLFSGGQLNNGDFTFPCTRTETTNFYRGFNLVSNPYSSYLDFNAVTKTNILPTMWYRTADLSQTMVFDTYNSELGVGTSVGGEAVTQFIPPMQSFWVKIPEGFTTGEIGFTNEMRSHYTIGFDGLKSNAQDFPVYLRFNLEDGLKKDQLILLMDQQMSQAVDTFDSEKMMIEDYPQIYAMVGTSELVINSLPYSKSKISVPITLDLPESKSYLFQTEEIHIEDGLVLLEDKQEEVFQDLSFNPCYGFYSNSGVISDRFVIHMNLPIGVQSGTLLLHPFLTNLSLNTDPFEISEINDQEIHVSFIDTLIGVCSLRIFDASGRLITVMKLSDKETTIQLKAGSGVYFIQMEINQQIFRKRIVLTQK